MSVGDARRYRETHASFQQVVLRSFSRNARHAICRLPTIPLTCFLELQERVAPMTRANSITWIPLVVALVLTIALCSTVALPYLAGLANGKVKVYPVEGRLLVSGKPAGNARIVFHPVEPGNSALYPVGVTQPDGSYRLTTYATGDGAPAGEYIVTVIWPHEAIPIDECDCVDPVTHDRLCGLYADPTRSPLRATIRPERNEITLQAT